MSLFKPKKKRLNQTFHSITPQDVMVADLLVKANVIRQDRVDECVRIAGSKRLSVGQMLITAGYLTSKQLEAAMDAHTTLQKRQLDEPFVLKCLNVACRSETGFNEAVANQQAEDESSEQGGGLTLGPLLLEAGVIDRTSLEVASQRSNATGLPIGRILVLNGVLQEKILGKALDLTVRMRDDSIAREDAVEALRAASGIIPGTPGTQNLLIPPRRRKVRLGELLLVAGIMSETDVLSAVEIGLLYEVQIGQVMIEQGYVSEYMVKAALELQDRVEQEQVSVEKAADVLRKVAEGSSTVTDLIGAFEQQLQAAAEPALSFERLMLLTRMISQEEINETLAKAKQDPELLSGLLVMAGLMTNDRRNAALRCFELVQKGRLTKDDAVVALDFCIGKDVVGAFDDAIRELGWTDALEGENAANSGGAIILGAQAPAPVAAPSAASAEASEDILGGEVTAPIDTLASSTPFADGVLNAAPSSASPAAPSSESSDVNLLEHFGLSSEAEPLAGAEPEHNGHMAEPARTAAREDLSQGWTLPDESGAGNSVAAVGQSPSNPAATENAESDESDIGTSTGEMPPFTFSDRLMQQGAGAQEPGQSNSLRDTAHQEGRLNSFLDRLSDGADPAFAAAESISAEAGATQPAISQNQGNGSGASVEAAPEPVAEAVDYADMPKVTMPKRDESQPRRPMTDKPLEQTMAPSGMKIDQSMLLNSAQPEVAEKKEAVTAGMYKLAEGYFAQEQFAEAQKIYEKILVIKQTELGAQHVDLVDDLLQLAQVLWVQGNFKQAEPFVRRAVTILEGNQPMDMLKLGEAVRILAGLYFQQGKFEPSVPLMEHALLLKQSVLGEEHPDVGGLLREYAKLLKKVGRSDEAEKYYLKAKKILAK